MVPRAGAHPLLVTSAPQCLAHPRAWDMASGWKRPGPLGGGFCFPPSLAQGRGHGRPLDGCHILKLT
jgi:hypothetical protein